ncbi:MAG: RluA family pseudouridine synthase [Desulfuromonadales bacterium]|nr:RluA family pseudouridine synthase [Desulfuromonadales bacterium]
MSETCCLQVTSEHVSMRLDRFLDDNLPELTRSQIKRLINEGAVTLNGNSSKAGTRLQGGEEICLTLPEPAPITARAESIPLAVLYEDEALIVVDKPAGMVVHPAPGHPQGTLVNALLHHCDDLSGIGGELRPGIVHRLDKDTSGVMVATKNDAAHQCLARQFKAHSIQRRYRALVYGLPEQNRGSVDQEIGRHPVHRKKMSTRSRNGRRAVTHWRVLRRYHEERLSLLDLALETGRTHQIRVHLSSLGFSVVGDPLYGNSSQAKRISDQRLKSMVAKLNRQFLHAWQLGFEHPNGQQMLFQAQFPLELQQMVELLEQKHQYNITELELPPVSERIEPATP